jgi:hypothetical protein
MAGVECKKPRQEVPGLQSGDVLIPLCDSERRSSFALLAPCQIADETETAGKKRKCCWKTPLVQTKEPAEKREGVFAEGELTRPGRTWGGV